jgi:hypothetical protein
MPNKSGIVISLNQLKVLDIFVDIFLDFYRIYIISTMPMEMAMDMSTMDRVSVPPRLARVSLLPYLRIP